MAIMAYSLSLLLPLLLASSASARPGLPFHPCKTLLISTYSVSFQPRNPDPHHPRPEFIAVVAELRGFRPDPRSSFPDAAGFFPDNPQFRPHHPRGEFIRASSEDETLIRHRRPDLGLGSTASFGDRTLDVLNVLASLLFGAACGALTAGTMYIIWSLFTSRFEAYQSLDDFSDDEDEDIFNPKKPQNNNNNNNNTTTTNKDEVCVAVPAPSSSADSAETALLKKESA